MTNEAFSTLFWREFDSVRAGSEFFHVSKTTISRWLSGTETINPMAEKLLIIKSIGYLPNDNRWRGFRIDEENALFITPTGQKFSPKELEAFCYWKNEYEALKAKFGRIEHPPMQPPKPNLRPFHQSGRRDVAPWIPTKFK